MSGDRAHGETSERQSRHYAATGTSGKCFGPKRPSPTPERLIIDMFPYSCCFFETPEVFVDEQTQRVPNELQARGIDQASWERAIGRLRSAIQDHSSSIAAISAAIILILPWIFVGPTIKDMHKAVKDALDEVNREIFEPRGVFVKTQKSVQTRGKDKYETAWLSIALSPQEIAILKEEPHIYVFKSFKGIHVPNAEACCAEADDCCGTPVVI